MQTRVSQAPEDYLFNLGKGIADFLDRHEKPLRPYVYACPPAGLYSCSFPMTRGSPTELTCTLQAAS
jgi:hypothetical protein